MTYLSLPYGSNGAGGPNAGLKKVATYGRNSDPVQVNSLGNQDGEMRRFCNATGRIIVARYEDEGISGGTGERVGWLQLLADAPTAEWDEVVIYTHNRFSRLDSLEGAFAKQLLREAGKKLVSVIEGEQDWDTPEGRIMSTIRDEESHGFLIRLAANCLSGALRKFLRGEPFGKKCPYGMARRVTDPQGTARDVPRTIPCRLPKGWRFEYVAGDAQEVDVVRWMFHTFANTDISLRELSRALNSRNTPSPAGVRWHVTLARRILRNDTYVGDIRLGNPRSEFMPVVHFLNVNDGDCSIIQHATGRTTVIDVNNAYIPEVKRVSMVINEAVVELSSKGPRGNFNQKQQPDNPIVYLRKLAIPSVFRFIATHGDMDHLDGVKELFSAFPPANFWDTANLKELGDGDFKSGRYKKEDWLFYKSLRDGNPQTNPKRLVYYAGDSNEYYKRDGLSILAPTKQLMAVANVTENWNDASYVILYRSFGQRILFAGDSEDATWQHILENYYEAVSNVDVLIAPHHGRDSGRDWEFLDVVCPRLTLFGNANCDHLAYDAWSNRGLEKITNNQAGYIVLDVTKAGIDVYVKNEKFARSFTAGKGYDTAYSQQHDGWGLGTLKCPVLTQ